MQLIGVTGKIHHGKSSFIDSLQRAEPASKSGESSTIISEAVNHLNDVLHTAHPFPAATNFPAVKKLVDKALSEALQATVPAVTGLDSLPLCEADTTDQPGHYAKLWSYLETARHDPAILTTLITPANKESYRPILQWTGGYVTTRLGRSLWYEELLRRADRDYSDNLKLYVIGGVRFALDAAAINAVQGQIIEIERPHLVELDADDPTEIARKQVPVDCQVLNNGSLEQLDKLAMAVVNDMYAKNLQSHYQAQAF